MPAAAIYDAVVNDLGFAIVSGHYPPGQRLTLSDIEEAHGVSRTVARDAVKTLAALGMVMAFPALATWLPGLLF